MATTMLAPTHDRISFAEPARRRPSIAATSTTDSSNPEDHYEDWSKITSEKESWAYRERRRSNKFSQIDSDMAMQSYEKQARSRSGRRGSSVLGIFQEGVDKNGNSIILSDDHHDDLEPYDEKLLSVPKSPRAMALVFPVHDDRRLSMSSQNSDKRRGSILSLWKTGKDKSGNDQVHSGHGDDWEDAISLNGSQSGSAPASPRLDDRGDRRGSILSIWKRGKDRGGNAVIHSGEEHDEDIVVLDENGELLEEVLSTTSSSDKEPQPRERLGSILSIWTQGKDKEGKSVILSGEEHEGPVPVIVEKEEGPPRGQERRGSMLSMWTEGRERDATERPGKVILTGFEEEGEE